MDGAVIIIACLAGLAWWWHESTKTPPLPTDEELSERRERLRRQLHPTSEERAADYEARRAQSAVREANPDLVDRSISLLGTSRLIAWVVIAIIAAGAFVLAVQAYHSLANPGHCLSGGGEGAQGQYCDEWESGNDGWWFLP